MIRNNRGLSRAAVVMLICIAGLLALLLGPGLRWYGKYAETNTCALAIESAQRKVAMAEAGGRRLTVEEAKAAATRDIVSWEDLCPSGGDCYLIPNADDTYTIVCALHCTDAKLRTRLNAQRARDELERELNTQRLLGKEPRNIALTLNGRTFLALRAETDPGFERGTALTDGYEGTVIYYMTDGEGQLTGIAYADEEHCANWRADEGWTGDSWT